MKQLMFENPDDAKRHMVAIQRLAAFAHVGVEDVRPLYENTLAEMLGEARITTYLPIFTARRVEKILLRTQKTNPGIGNDDSP
jgi:hypothetical protein